MLFNSYIFLFAFLPLTLGVFHAIRGMGAVRSALAFLVGASLVFYAWWSATYVWLIIGLTVFNAAAGQVLLWVNANAARWRKPILVTGLTVNLGALAYFKYTNFLLDNLGALLGRDFGVAAIVLPIGISFFTFQKVAFLVDLYANRTTRVNLLDFALFVTFFPQLIAGPICHHSELIPQFRRAAPVSGREVALGLTYFVLGLGKKMLLADPVAAYASPVFGAAAAGTAVPAMAAWTGALAYTGQLYFDFSAYSDMAIGLGLLFGIRLPINFDSPYKADGIIDFWRRWHITLSRFLRDYLYIPLGGNRKGPARRYVNLFLTMLLGGLWHGAGWTFVVWGALHGLYLTVNHGWRALVQRAGWERAASSTPALWAGRVLTFLAVVAAWVFFRAPDTASAVAILRSMIGLGGAAGAGTFAGLDLTAGLAAALAVLCLAWFAPNTHELTGYAGPEGFHRAPDVDRAPSRLAWTPSPAWAVALGLVFAACLLRFSQISEFIYFQF